MLLAKRVCEHPARHGVHLLQVQWQTDNGSEFMDDAHHRGLPSTVRAMGTAPITTSRRKAYTWQSDVETLHRLVEDEFFDGESLRNVPEFWAKVDTYRWYFDLGRPNRGKGRLTSLEILRQRAPNLDPAITTHARLT